MIARLERCVHEEEARDDEEDARADDPVRFSGVSVQKRGKAASELRLVVSFRRQHEGPDPESDREEQHDENQLAAHFVIFGRKLTSKMQFPIVLCSRQLSRRNHRSYRAANRNDIKQSSQQQTEKTPRIWQPLPSPQMYLLTSCAKPFNHAKSSLCNTRFSSSLIAPSRKHSPSFEITLVTIPVVKCLLIR